MLRSSGVNEALKHVNGDGVHTSMYVESVDSLELMEAQNRLAGCSALLVGLWALPVLKATYLTTHG